MKIEKLKIESLQFENLKIFENIECENRNVGNRTVESWKSIIWQLFREYVLSMNISGFAITEYELLL